ncbi:alpha-L-fucosidase [Carboxylicivirga caseinilyticus]|uniref:alpha-L-fucosidase n=1 Tax=Carboxylicivirga caseinilyticus TaxID=3417572 RepID=UPI003D332956|nr:alpha-L-fucosidase [Marinilabiliaceae bacterium A049]
MEKRIVFCLFVLSLIVGCNGPSGLLMKTANTIAVTETDTPDSIILKAAHVVPTQEQIKALEDEFIAFIHFGPNTFTQKEWGNGFEDPMVFNLQNINTDQWCESIKAAGMTKVIFTAKHHDGFVLWQSRYTKHGVMSSPFENGKGDVLKHLSASCQKYGLKLGIYLSPADLYQIESLDGLYGNLSSYTDRVIPRPVKGRPFENKATFTANVDDYNEYFMNQLFELLTEYGPIHEVWFDGAHPKHKGGQKYNYRAWRKMIKELAPDAVIFGKEDIRWCGNEEGDTRNTEWNVIPYQDNPQTMNMFPDLMDHDLASEEKLVQGKYLHYQPAETNTSIREGWFYRDDLTQMVRSTDDVFDMYERSVGGNSIFLLNIPPNRDGLFSDEDVKVLKETGERIKNTYGTNLFASAAGSTKVLDGNTSTFELLDETNNSIEITTKEPVTINRFVIQEAIQSHGERVADHKVEAWIKGEWKEIAKGTNIGYKRILRFPQVTSDKFRFTVLDSRYYPAIANIAAYYCDVQPPQLQLTRDIEGKVTIEPSKHVFRWKLHGLDPVANLNKNLQIRYTLDGSEPTMESELFTEPVLIESAEVKARAFNNGKQGPVLLQNVGLIKKDWKVKNTSSQLKDHEAVLAIDADVETYWLTNAGHKHTITIDLSELKILKGFSYTPQKENKEGMIQRGVVEISSNGKSWVKADDFEFGNLINMPTTRTHYFKESVEAQFVRITTKEIAGDSQQAAIAEIDLF